MEENSNLEDYSQGERLPKDMKDLSYDNTYFPKQILEKNNIEISSKSDLDKSLSNLKSIQEDFEILKSITDYDPEHISELYKDGEDLDRYSDILPYNHNRVILGDKSKYINASYIHTPYKNSFIATQGPKINTINDFWQMAFDNNTVLIIMVCNLIEKKYPKCHNYWSSNNILKNFTLTKIYEKEIDANLREQEFQLLNTKTNETRTIKHLHFVGWPDHGVPELNDVYDSFVYILNQIDEAKTKSQGPVIVHCSAGIGRTGTLMAMYNIHHIVQKQIREKQKTLKFNIWNTVRKLKEQRLHSVEAIQYKFLNSFILKYLHNLFK